MLYIIVIVVTILVCLFVVVFLGGYFTLHFNVNLALLYQKQHETEQKLQIQRRQKTMITRCFTD